MSWSPLPELVTLNEAKQRIKLPLDSTAEDADLSLQLDIAHEVVLDFVAQRVSDQATWQATIDAWSAGSVPRRVKGAILAQFVWAYSFRGDDLQTPARMEGSAICPEAASLLMRMRDPALA